MMTIHPLQDEIMPFYLFNLIFSYVFEHLWLFIPKYFIYLLLL